MNEQPMEIGKRYWVECRRVRLSCWPNWIPILGPLHDDAEIVNFPERHWHIDWRFVPRHFYLNSRRTCGIDEFTVYGRVLSEKNTYGAAIRRLTMRREFDPYPHQIAKWMPELERAYAGHKLGNCLTCPHRGISLVGVKPDENGVITCPGHGLRWDLKSGRLVHRGQQELFALQRLVA